MNTTIDGAGRVVVPKALRETLGLVPGTALEIREQDGALLLQPAPVPMRLVRRGRGLVALPAEPLPKLTARQVRETLEASRR